jgi:hypothetical protein
MSESIYLLGMGLSRRRSIRQEVFNNVLVLPRGLRVRIRLLSFLKIRAALVETMMSNFLKPIIVWVVNTRN